MAEDSTLNCQLANLLSIQFDPVAGTCHADHLTASSWLENAGSLIVSTQTRGVKTSFETFAIPRLH
jgi:hypothetical protein